MISTNPCVVRGLLLLLLLASCHGKPTPSPDQDELVAYWDTIVAYILVLLWAIVQSFLHVKLPVIRKRTVYVITFVAYYIQLWIYAAFIWLIVGLALAASKDYLFNNVLTAVAAKTIAFLLLERITVPPKGIADCLDKIHNATRVKWGQCSIANKDEEEGPVDDADGGGDKVWIKFVLVYSKEPRYKKLKSLLKQMSFKTGKWEGIYETGHMINGVPELKLNSLRESNQEQDWTQEQLQKLYVLTREDRDKVNATGCIFTHDDYRIAKRLTKKSWVSIFNDECEGDWFYVLARQLQFLLPTEVLNAPMPANDKAFLDSNVYGRLRRRGLVQGGAYCPSLVDKHLFEAAVHESFRKTDQMQVDDVIEIIYKSKTYEDAADEFFSWICEL